MVNSFSIFPEVFYGYFFIFTSDSSFLIILKLNSMKQTFVGGMIVGQLGFQDPKGNKKKVLTKPGIYSRHYIPTVDRTKKERVDRIS